MNTEKHKGGKLRQVQSFVVECFRVWGSWLFGIYLQY